MPMTAALSSHTKSFGRVLRWSRQARVAATNGATQGCSGRLRVANRRAREGREATEAVGGGVEWGGLGLGRGLGLGVGVGLAAASGAEPGRGGEEGGRGGSGEGIGLALEGRCIL